MCQFLYEFERMLWFAEKFRFSAGFIEVRQRALDVFLNRIATHPQLCMSEDLRNFLQADEEVWVGVIHSQFLCKQVRVVGDFDIQVWQGEGADMREKDEIIIYWL